ncbi:MAG: T9SS type A sorting domain-containing protein [Candidatus Cloacimonetes bacterium]|nr:T9SS type A sorting domain-containing protein [Candidatus Cloacimonadota bacterium]
MQRYLVLFILLISIGLSATILNVPQNYHYISLAIIAATDGDTVLVQPGTYNGIINFDGKAITLASTYIFTNNEADIHHTILGGNYSDASLISFINGEGEGSILTGFTITNAGAPAQGGAVFCDGTSPTLLNLRFSDNQATSGGAIFTNEANPTIENCEFINNSSTEFGGAIYLEASEMTMNNCRLQNNNSDGAGTLGRGGAVFVSYSTVDLTNCNFYENTANVHAGAVYLSYASANILKCQFVGNTAGGNVGAVYSYKSTHLEVINCLFYNNSGTNAGSLRFYTDVAPTDVPIVLNTICYGNTPCEIFFASDNLSHELIIAYSDLQGGEDAIVTNNVAEIVWLEGNIDADPMYVAPEYDHFFLQPESPCIDAAQAVFEYEGITYIDTDSYLGDNLDMGPCETDVDNPAILAMFEADIMEGDAPLTVNFTDLSLGEPTSWEWYSNGDIIPFSQEQNPQWIFEEPGTYSIRLVAYNDEQTDWINEIDLIQVNVPSAADEDLPPANIALSVYPNPFNPSTTLDFSLSESENVTLAAYNLKGEKIDLIFNDILPAGNHKLTWEPQSLPSGIYFIRLIHNHQSTTSKAILLK